VETLVTEELCIRWESRFIPRIRYGLRRITLATCLFADGLHLSKFPSGGEKYVFSSRNERVGPIVW